jgi:hypothetical protein
LARHSIIQGWGTAGKHSVHKSALAVGMGKLPAEALKTRLVLNHLT